MTLFDQFRRRRHILRHVQPRHHHGQPSAREPRGAQLTRDVRQLRARSSFPRGPITLSSCCGDGEGGRGQGEQADGIQFLQQAVAVLDPYGRVWGEQGKHVCEFFALPCQSIVCRVVPRPGYRVPSDDGRGAVCRIAGGVGREGVFFQESVMGKKDVSRGR